MTQIFMKYWDFHEKNHFFIKKSCIFLKKQFANYTYVVVFYGCLRSFIFLDTGVSSETWSQKQGEKVDESVIL